MATPKWDPIDPEDIVDLWVDFGPPFLPLDEEIVEQTVEVPEGVTLLTHDIDGQKIRIRTGPNPLGSHELNYHFVTDTGQEFDTTVILTVKERIRK